MPDCPKLRGIAIILAVLLAIVIVLAAIAGVRFSEKGAGEPKFGERVRFNWTAETLFVPDTWMDSEPFRVSHGTATLTVRYDVHFPSRDVGEWGSTKESVRFEPCAVFELIGPSGATIWETSVNSTDSDVVIQPEPQPGNWRLLIEIQGYGGENLGLEVHDSVGIVVRTTGG